jgi:hypothetical protein
VNAACRNLTESLEGNKNKMILTNARLFFLISALVVLGSLSAQTEANKNDIGLVISATTTPSVGLATGERLAFNSSLALGQNMIGGSLQSELRSMRESIFSLPPST